MGLYIRKSVSVGPFRFNLSGSGVGISVGVPGFRVGISPRGNYVHVGRAGIYYSATIPRQRRSQALPHPVPPPAVHGSHVVMEAIESAETATIVDSNSQALVAEMHAKRRKWRLWPWVLSCGVVGLLAISNQWPSLPAWASGVLVGMLGAATFSAMLFDRIRKTTVLMYDFESGATSNFERLHAAFEALSRCAGKWHISSQGKVRDRKYHAGASSLVTRKPIGIECTSPPFVKTNVSVPSIPVGKQTLYFFPDLILVFEPNAVGAVSYSKLDVECVQTRFIEEERVPSDAKVVDRTWRFVNKSGGPDRRFKDNKELPIALYDEMRLSSDTGLNEVVQLSRAGTLDAMRAALASLRESGTRTSARTIARSA